MTDDGDSAVIRRLMGGVNTERMSRNLFHLAKDPLPCRKLNLTLPGHEKNTLYEADDYIASLLQGAGYAVTREGVPVRAFRRDMSKPKHEQYAPPRSDDPVHTAYNLYAERRGRSRPERIILVCAHKDSQSWIDSPGANDNAIGTVGALEMALVLARHDPECTIRFLWCNEEHTPWTSVAAARNAKARSDDLVAIFNLDGLGVKTDEARTAGKMTNVMGYTKPEGRKLAELVCEESTRYSIGLEQSIAERPSLGDDDGSFVEAGYPAAIICIGSWPYGDSEYHSEGDIPERCDVGNATLTVQAILAAVLTLDSGPGRNAVRSVADHPAE